MALPVGYGGVENLVHQFVGDLLYQFVLNIGQHLGTREVLVPREGLVVDVELRIFGVGEAHPHGNGEPRLRGVGVFGYGLRGEVVVGDFALELQVAAAADNLQPRLARVGVLQRVGEELLERGIDQRCLDGEVGNRDGLGGVVVDRGPVELVGDAARGEGHEQYGDEAFHRHVYTIPDCIP